MIDKITLASARINKKLKQSDVAKKLKCTPAMISYYEKHPDRIPNGVTTKLLKLYGLKFEDIFFA